MRVHILLGVNREVVNAVCQVGRELKLEVHKCVLICPCFILGPCGDRLIGLVVEVAFRNAACCFPCAEGVNALAGLDLGLSLIQSTPGFGVDHGKRGGVLQVTSQHGVALAAVLIRTALEAVRIHKVNLFAGDVAALVDELDAVVAESILIVLDHGTLTVNDVTLTDGLVQVAVLADCKLQLDCIETLVLSVIVPLIAVAAITNDERAEMNFFMTTYSFLVFFPGRRSARFKHIVFDFSQVFAPAFCLRLFAGPLKCCS